ncbi:hypothetical protein [Nocardioides astragali]|uniref:hypothetical protein n=1 Tax=Nocardioides astragali TaxID=1776736 RepID=UPI0036D421AD
MLIYLALGIAAVTSTDTALVRAAYLAMDWAAWVVLVPLAVASLVTGVVQSLVTRWGLMRHYWVIFKLAITVVATTVLVAYTGTLDQFASIATEDRSRASTCGCCVARPSSSTPPERSSCYSPPPCSRSTSRPG